MRLHACWADELKEVDELIRYSLEAANELKTNKKFEKMLHVILSLGNALNDGTTHVAAGYCFTHDLQLTFYRFEFQSVGPPRRHCELYCTFKMDSLRECI